MCWHRGFSLCPYIFSTPTRRALSDNSNHLQWHDSVRLSLPTTACLWLTVMMRSCWGLACLCHDALSCAEDVNSTSMCVCVLRMSIALACVCVLRMSIAVACVCVCCWNDVLCAAVNETVQCSASEMQQTACVNDGSCVIIMVDNQRKPICRLILLSELIWFH